jgi:D-glycero-D-manno-heptose 1,7-bisphosphate phosphatase
VTSRQRAAFVDRDGVLNVDHGYVHRIDDFEWLPGAVQALQRLQSAGFALVVVTNQSGIARGMYTEADLARLHRFVDDDLQHQGVQLTGIYACPHHPQATLDAYRQDCDCRKPRPGLILRAGAEHGLDLARSCLFGDKASDIEAGRAAGVGHCWLIGSPAAAVVCGADGHSDSLAAAVTAQLGAAAC